LTVQGGVLFPPLLPGFVVGRGVADGLGALVCVAAVVAVGSNTAVVGVGRDAEPLLLLPEKEQANDARIKSAMTRRANTTASNDAVIRRK
jgi:hypothetical protein